MQKVMVVLEHLITVNSLINSEFIINILINNREVAFKWIRVT